MFHLLGLVLLSPFASISSADGSIRFAVKPEEASGYAANPSTLAAPLRQDLTTGMLVPTKNGRYEFILGGDDSKLRLAELDMNLYVPRIPEIAKGNEDLARFALLQREYNRNEVKFGKVDEAEDFKIANNCLKQGLWEIMLDKKVEKGNAMFFHGWFTFPEAEYARVFETLNGKPYADYKKFLAAYPTITGMPAPLDELRTVVDQSAVEVKTMLDEAPIRFGEQKRKAMLVLTPDIATYRDFTDAKKQPISVASFMEPGFYDPKNPVKFDLTWLATPTSAVHRHVKSVRGGTSLDEFEVQYANGLRLVFADRDIAKLAPRTAAPDNDKDTLRLTFGIGTPDIYATLAERIAEMSDDRPNYLFLLGKDGKHVDNHQTGVDRVFLWSEGGATPRLHVYLVGYERIAVVSHLVLPMSKP